MTEKSTTVENSKKHLTPGEVQKNNTITCKSTSPRSASSVWINLTSLLAVIVTLYIYRHFRFDTLTGGIILMAVVIAIIAGLEAIVLKPLRQETSAVDFSKKGEFDFFRILIKLVGLWATIGFIAFLFWLFPLYKNSLFNTSWKFYTMVLPVLALISIPYFTIIDGYMKKPCDGYWNFGLLVTGNWKKIDFYEIKHHILGWLVKAFFFTLLFPGFVGNIGYFYDHPIVNPFRDFNAFFDGAKNFIFLIDLLYEVVGYLATIKLFDSHVRWAEPTMFGWVIALMCYEPFWPSTFYPHFLNYDDQIVWSNWLTPGSDFTMLWGFIILGLLAFYSWGTIQIGIRFSNLTNRGIITNGPYGIFKHPAYVTKNIAWWLISVPFISSVGPGIALQHCTRLLILNCIYGLRAYTEEKHLSKDPHYVQYALAMNKRDPFAKYLGAILPFFKYDPKRYGVAVEQKESSQSVKKGQK